MEQSVLSDLEARRDQLARELAARDSAAKKAGGAVYTPPHVVDYVIERTVGRLLDGKNPREVARLRILDPACGAGAFLLAAYRYLLDWHLGYYSTHDPHHWATSDPPTLLPVESNRKSAFRLSFTERRRMLLNSIFGVDIDPAAVELCRLSVLLAMLDADEAGHLSSLRDLDGCGAPFRRLKPTAKSCRPFGTGACSPVPKGRQDLAGGFSRRITRGKEDESPEGATEPSDGANSPLGHPALAAIVRNIRCGDALIGPDFACQGTLFEGADGGVRADPSITPAPPLRRAERGQGGEEAGRAVRLTPPFPLSGRGEGEAKSSRAPLPTVPFDWQAEFPEVFSGDDPGFDLVLGNPPYLSYSGREAVPLDPAVRAYFARTYETAGWPTAHGLFIERAVTLLSRRIVAFVVPDQVGHLAGYRAVRALVARHSRLAEVRYWGEDVFPGVVTPALTFIADKEHVGVPAVYPREEGKAASSRRTPKAHAPHAGGGPENASAFGVRRLDAALECGGSTPLSAARARTARPSLIGQAALSDGAPWITCRRLGLLERLRERSFSLGGLVADIGVHTGNCARKLIFPLPPREGPPPLLSLRERPPFPLSPRESTPPSLSLRERAGVRDAPSHLAGPAEGVFVPILEGKQISRYQCLPPAKALRLDYSPGAGEYFRIRPEARYASAPFLIRQTAAYPIVGPRLGAVYFRNSLLALYPPSNGLDIRYLVALLNSKLLRFLYMELVPESRQRVFPQVKISSLRQLPIRSIDLSDSADAAAHARLVALVDRLLALHAALAAAASPAERPALLQQAEAVNGEIDGLVSQVYGVTPAQAATLDGEVPHHVSRR